MVKHMVMWSFKEEIPEEKKPELKAQIKEHLEGLVGVVPGLIKAEVVTDLLPSSTRDLCLITELESAEALAAYAVNPNHVHVADTYVRPNVCYRVAMDFEVQMEIRIITVGKIKEKYLNDGIAEYAKRLGRYCKLNFIQVPDEKTPDKASDALNRQIKETEGNRLLSHIRDTDYVIALAIEGKILDSVELSDLIARLGVQGKSSIAFVIGGSLGLSDAVLKRADYKLSFSKMTFPHQLMQMILLEQIYRSYRIINHEPYHK